MNNATLRNIRQQSFLKEAGRTRLTSKSITAKTSTDRSHCNHLRSYNKNTTKSHSIYGIYEKTGRSDGDFASDRLYMTYTVVVQYSGSGSRKAVEHRATKITKYSRF